MSSIAGDGEGPSRDVRPIGDGVGMDEDGSAEGGRTRLARGTKPNAAVGEHECAGGANADTVVAAVGAPRGSDGARVRSALLMAPARAGSLPASPDTARGAARPDGAPEPSHAGPVPTAGDATAGGAVGQALRGIAARGSGPVPAGSAPDGAGRAPAQSIREAVEQLIEAQEADEAIAEWMQGGG